MKLQEVQKGAPKNDVDKRATPKAHKRLHNATQGLRGLQSTADKSPSTRRSHILQRLADQHTSRQDPKTNANFTKNKAPIQRRVGFEFEIGNMSTTKTNAIGTRKKLNKADPLVTGVGYTIEADEESTADPCYANTSYSGYSDLEAAPCQIDDG